MPAAEPIRGGLVLVDKPAGMTSHDVVARIRRLAGTRRVGHAGTLDPMATGMLIVGIGRATRLLGHLALHDKDYLATVRLGQTTSSDDADGELLTATSAVSLTIADVEQAACDFVGRIEQRPPAVSAIKVGGVRAYARARAGEPMLLASRTVEVRQFDVIAAATAEAADGTPVLDVEVSVGCSSGTYVRALARDLGGALGVGGHLVALRRTRVGGFALAQARTLDELQANFEFVPIDLAAAAAFAHRRELDAAQVDDVVHGRALPASGLGAGPVAAFGPAGEFVALLDDRDGAARSLAVFAG